MRECPESQTVAAYVDDQLPADEREPFLDHIADCDECRREVVLTVLSRGEASVPVPTGMCDRLLAAAGARAREGCPDSEALAAYVEERLEAEEAAGLVEHLGECDECRREVALVEMQHGSSQISRAVPAELKARVIAAAGRRESRRLRPVARGAPPPIAGWFAAAAALLVAAVVVIAAARKTHDAPPGSTGIVRQPEVPAPERAPDLTPPPAPKPGPEAPKPDDGPLVIPPRPEAPKPHDEVPVAPEPKPEPAPRTEPKPAPTRVRETAALKFGAVKLTDLTGELAVRRKGRAKGEKIGGPTVVSHGDVLIAEKTTAFFMLDDIPVTLMPQSQVGVSFEVGTSTPALLLERGEALVDSTVAETRWYVGTKDVSVWIDPTRAKFSAAVEDRSLSLTALTGHLTGKDDYGRPFDLRRGERLLASADAAATAPDPDAARKSALLTSTRPHTRTLFSAAFEPSAGLALAEGAIDRQGEFLAAADRKGTLTGAVKLARDVFYRGDLVIRMRVRTNLEHSKIAVTVEDRAQFVVEHRVRANQRMKWITVEFALDGEDVKLVPLNDVGTIITPRDRIVAVGATGRRQEAFGDERAYIHLDDVQVALRAP